MPALVRVGLATLLVAVGLTSSARAGSTYLQTNLVSNQAGMAETTDANLINPWGISYTTKSPFWVSNQGSGTTTVYPVSGTTTSGTALTVTIPNLGGAASGSMNGPTGQVSPFAPGIMTSSTDFQVNGKEAAFIFANLDGSISAWNGGSQASIVAMNTTASYTGLAIGNSGGNAYIYAANQNNGNIDVYDSNWHLIKSFSDPYLPSGYVAYNVQNINGTVFATFVNPHNELGGVIAEFNTDGTFIKTLVNDTGGATLQTPWGMALAPTNFGQFSGDLLVGNNGGNGWINAYSLTGTWEGALQLANGSYFSEKELWGLSFGNGGHGGASNTLYFDAGLAGGKGGLFGALAVVPEPSSFVLGLIGMGSLAGIWRFQGRGRIA